MKTATLTLAIALGLASASHAEVKQHSGFTNFNPSSVQSLLRGGSSAASYANYPSLGEPEGLRLWEGVLDQSLFTRAEGGTPLILEGDAESQEVAALTESGAAGNDNPEAPEKDKLGNTGVVTGPNAGGGGYINEGSAGGTSYEGGSGVFGGFTNVASIQTDEEFQITGFDPTTGEYIIQFLKTGATGRATPVSAGDVQLFANQSVDARERKTSLAAALGGASNQLVGYIVSGITNAQTGNPMNNYFDANRARQEDRESGNLLSSEVGLVLGFPTGRGTFHWMGGGMGADKTPPQGG